MNEWTISRPEELWSVIPDIINQLGNRKKIALYGEMGAGKTTFAKVFARIVGVVADTSSPTFSLVNAYPLTDDQGRQGVLHHLDLYRLRHIQEVLDIGIDEILYDSWYCLIEWPQIIESVLPDDTARITIEALNEHTRRIRMN